MENTGIGRRSVLAGGLGLAGATLTAGLVGGCAKKGENALRIGYVSPQTGPLAPFGAADSFVVDRVRELLKDGIEMGGTRVPVEILVRDSQSNPSRAAAVAGELIKGEKVDLMLVSSTPETTNPVSDQCELAGTPCISTVSPWQPWFFGRGGKPDAGFRWTYHFFWGLEDVIQTYMGMWEQVPTNKSVGGLFPNDGDGNAWGDPKLGFPPALAKGGYQLDDPGRFQSLTDDFSSQISSFRNASAEILTGVVIPPDLTSFWTQARQQGLRPKVASIGKALLFPSAVEALGDAGHNLSTEVWWSPSHPFKSSLSGASCGALAETYTAATKAQWTQPIGFVHALFEIAVDVARRAGKVGDKAALRDAIAQTSLDTIVGRVDWSKGPMKNVAKTPLVGGQWRRSNGGPFKFDLVITANPAAPSIPTQSRMEALA